jgi:hypothetical protein
LTLRNPTDRPAALALNLKAAFELPAGSASQFELKSPWKNVATEQSLELSAEQPHKFNLRPFEVLTLEAKAVAGGERAVTETLGASANLKNASFQ